MLLHEETLEASAARTPDKVALVVGETRYTYAQIDAMATGLAAVLRARGVARGDRVATFLDNGVEAVVSIYGALKCGAVFMPVNPLTKKGKLAYLLNDSRAVALVAHSTLHAEVHGALAANTSVRTCFLVGDARAARDADARYVSFPAHPAEAVTFDAPPTIDQDLASIIYT